MANFKPVRGDYAADQALYTVEAESYEPNDYQLCIIWQEMYLNG